MGSHYLHSIMMSGLRCLVLLGVSPFVSSKCEKTCTSAVRDRLEIESSGYFNAYYRDSRRGSLGVKDETLEYVLLYNHGNGQNGDQHFCVMQQNVRQYFCKNDDNDCIDINKAYVVAPQFDGPEMRKSQDEICFDSATDPWNGGDESLPECSNPTFSSFTILDNILASFLDREKYPNLKKVVAAGHSGGGQTIGRYALGSNIDDRFSKIGVEFQFY